MINPNSEVSFYVDTLIVETLLSDGGLSKTAQAGSIVSGLIDKVKNYFGSHVDPNDKAGSVLNILAPGVISMTFKAMGLGWLGLLFGLATNIFHINIAGILESIYGKIKSMITGDKQVTSAQVNEAVQSSVQEHTKPATEEEANQAAQLMDKKSTSQLLRDARFLKLAMVEYDTLNSGLLKEAAPSFLSMFSSRKSTTANLLTKVLMWIFKVALASAGLMVAGDVINKFLGRPNALDGSMQGGKPTGTPSPGLFSAPEPAPAAPANVAKQTRFPVSPSYKPSTKNVGGNNWTESVSNDKASIDAMLVQFAKDVYQGLDGLEAYIRTAPGFQVISDRILDYNHTAAGNAMVFIPTYFTSKKQIVDFFIDDVAENAPQKAK